MTYRHLKSFIFFFCFVLYFNSHQRYFQLKGEWMYNCLWLIFKKCPGFCKKNASYLQMILFWSMLQSGMRIWNKNISRFCLNSRKRFKNIKLWIFLLLQKMHWKSSKKIRVWGKTMIEGGFSWRVFVTFCGEIIEKILSNGALLFFHTYTVITVYPKFTRSN